MEINHLAAEAMLRDFLKRSFPKWEPLLPDIELLKLAEQYREADVRAACKELRKHASEFLNEGTAWLLDRFYHCDGRAIVDDIWVGIDVTVNPNEVSHKLDEINDHRPLLQLIGIQKMLVIHWTTPWEVFKESDLKIYEEVIRASGNKSWVESI